LVADGNVFFKDIVLSTQALAIRPIATKLERISVDTFRLTMDQPVQGWEDFLQIQSISATLSFKK
jgi:hypothetical protein